MTMSSNVLPLQLKETFPPKIWIFTKSEGDGIKSRLPFKIFSTLKPWIKKSDDLKVQLAANIEAFDFEGDKNAIKIVNRLGNLCQWRSKIFQAFSGPKEPGWKGWKQMPPTIFADLGKNVFDRVLTYQA